MENSSMISQLLRTLTFLLITFFTHPTFTKAQNAVGSVNGALTVNDMGAAVYSVTFDAPNGGRMTPKIGLAYSSQSSGYGLAGYGIDITGISVITSGGRDMFHNGKVRGANYDKDSNFYLDGKRLVLQEGEDGEGGTLYAPEGDPYTKVTLHGDINSGTAYFEVTATDGTVFTYGSGNNSRLQVVKGGSTRTAAWYVTTAVNRYGESINYAYHNENLCVSPQTITYGTDRGLTAKVEFSYRDMAGANVRTYRIGSQQGMRNKLLSSVTTSINGQTYRKYDFAYDETASDRFSRLTTITESNGAGESLNPTELTWNTSSSVEVTHTDVTGIQTRREEPYSKDGEDNSYTTIDLNGDGIADLIRICYGKQGSESLGYREYSFVYVYTGYIDNMGKIKYNSPLRFKMACPKRWGADKDGNNPVVESVIGSTSAMDYDGDGLNDLVFSMFTDNDGTKYESNFILFGKDVKSNCDGIETRCLSVTVRNSSCAPCHASLDMNSDGRDEIISIEKEEQDGLYRMTVLACLRIEDSGDPFNEVKEQYISLPSKPQHAYTGDYNGDGLPDLFFACESGYAIYYNNGYIEGQDILNVFTSDNHYEGNAVKDYWRMEQGDFDGDGLVDFFCHDSDTRQFSIAYYNGDGTFRKQTFADNWGVYDDSGTDEDNNKFSVIVTDFDNDGKSDVVLMKACYIREIMNRIVYDRTDVRWLHSTGNGLELTRAFEFNGEDQSVESRIVASDLDGDGKIEFASMGILLDASNSIDDEGTMHIYKAGTADASVGRLTSLKDGFGNVTSLGYAYATRKDVYSQSEKGEWKDGLMIYVDGKWTMHTKPTVDSYPINRYTLPIALVSSIKSAGTDVSYGYKDLRLHIAGRGMMGFGTTTKTDNIHGVTESKEVTKWDTKYWLPTESTMTNTILSTGEESSIRSEYVIRNQGVSYNSANVYTDYDGNQKYEQMYPDSDSGMPAETQKMDGDGTWGTMVATEQFPEYERINGAWVPRHKDVEMFREEDGNSSIYYEDYTYDSQANMTRKVITGMKLDDAKWDFEDGGSIETDYTYDRWGNVTSETFHGNDESTGYKYYEYDTSGRFVVKTYTVPESTTTTYTYDVFGNVLTETDETNASNPLTTMHEYDSWGRRIASYYPDGTGSAYEMGWSSIGGAGGYYTKESHTAAPWVRKYYDSRGREVRTETVGAKGIGISKVTAYNDKGQVVTVTDKYGKRTSTETFEYDARGRVVSDQHSSGAGCTYEYGRNTVSTTDAKGRTVTKTYNVFGDLLQVTDPIGGKVKYKYYSSGKPMEITSGNATVYMEYDEFNRRTKLVDPDAGTVTITYGRNGQVSSETDGRGVKTTYTYDALGRVTQRKREGVVDRLKRTEITSYTYGTTGNAKGRVTERNNGYGIKYEYDEYGRVIKEIHTGLFCHCGQTHELCKSYTYNSLGLLESITYPTLHSDKGLTIKNTYDTYGFKTKEAYNNSTLYSVSVNDGNTYRTLSSKFGYCYTGYDKDGFPTYKYYRKGTTMLDSLCFEYDHPSGNLTSRTINKVTDCFEYDNLDRLTSVNRDGVEIMAMTYAGNGNIMNKSDIGDYTYNPADKPHAVREIDLVTDEQSGYSSSVSYALCGKAESIFEYCYSYGPDDEKFLGGRIDPSDPETKYWDINNIYWDNYECEMKDFHYREYYFLDNDVIIIRDSYSGEEADTHPATLSYYQAVTDNLGSIIAVFDNKLNRVFEASYDAWGRQTVKFDEIGLYRGFTGHENVGRSELVNMNHRVYDSSIGRFLSPDNYVQLPENSQSFNRYSYCINNPLKYTDPTGQIFGIDDALLAGIMFAVVPNVISNLASGDNGWAAVGKGILSAAMSYGIGSAFDGASKTLGNALLKAGAHGLSGGVQNALNGENFGIGFATGAIASFAGYGAQSAHFNACGVVGATTLAGGLTSWALGGDFFDGAMIGLSIGMMNDNLHQIDGGELPEAVCNGRKPFWMRAKEALEPAAGVAGNMAYAVGAYDHVSKNARIDSNGKFRFRKANGRIFYGNQNVKTNAIPKIPHAQGLGIGLSFVSELPDVAGAYYRYGVGSREFWRATTIATGRVAGGLTGGRLGTLAGGYVGGALGSAIPIIGNGAGYVAGGMAGGMIGTYVGSEMGGYAAGYLFDVIF